MSEMGAFIIAVLNATGARCRERPIAGAVDWKSSCPIACWCQGIQCL